MEAEFPSYLLVLIPLGFIVFFSALWLGITALLARLSGWPRLERAFPDRPETPLQRLRYRSGAMGGLGSLMPVNYRNVLNLDVCPSGLRISVMRLLGPFSKPFFVPWTSIAVTQQKLLFLSAYRLSFGKPEVGSLTLAKSTVAEMDETARLVLPEG